MREKNPNPSTVPDPMWWLWTDRPNQSWKFGGIYAKKKAYHNTVNANKENWPNNYSIQLPLDLKPVANFNYARAIDLSMSPSEMIKWTSRMKTSALDPRDNRLAAVKEFYGTLDGKTVYGLSKDSEDGKWERSSADDTHLWHGHMSVFTFYVNNWAALRPILSVWAGESFEDWNDMSFLPKQGDESQEVRFWQMIHNTVRRKYAGLPMLELDGDWGPSTTAAVKAFWSAVGGKGTYQGNYMDSWVAYQYLNTWMSLVEAPINPDFVQRLVIDEVAKQFAKLKVTGTFTGEINHGV